MGPSLFSLRSALLTYLVIAGDTNPVVARPKGPKQSPKEDNNMTDELNAEWERQIERFKRNAPIDWDKLKQIEERLKKEKE